jgi:excisionase family DNA binding protein
MKNERMDSNTSVPILFPFEPAEFWTQIRKVIQEEVSKIQYERQVTSAIMETPGLTEKPLYKINEICMLFNVSKPTIYEWIKHGKLRRVKIRSRVYFLGKDIQQLLQT